MFAFFPIFLRKFQERKVRHLIFKMSTIARTPACHHNRPQESLPPSGRDTILQLSEGAAISEVLRPADHLSCSVEMRLRESPTSWITWPLLLWSS